MPTIDIDPDFPRVQYTATPGQTVFSYPFIIFDQNDLEVIQEGSVLTIGSGNDYTVTGVENEDGGTVVLTSGASDGDVVTITRKSEIKRVSQFQTAGRFDAAPLERTLDFIVTVLQEIDRDVQRTVRLADDDPLSTVELPENREGKFLSFGPDGSPVVADAVDVSAIPFGVTGTALAATSTEAAARTVLGLGDLVTITSGLSGSTAGQVLTANGSSGATFSDVSVASDTTPQLGGMLDVNGQAIGDGTRELITFTEDASAVNHVNIENEAAGSGPIISAAGDDANINLNINPKGTGAVVLDGLSWPTSDGTANQVLQTDGSGALSFASNALRLVSTTDVTVAAATVDFAGVFEDGKNYVVFFSGLRKASTANVPAVRMRFEVSSSFNTGDNYNWSGRELQTNIGVGINASDVGTSSGDAASDNYIELVAGLNDGAADSASGVLFLPDPASTAGNASVFGFCQSRGAAQMTANPISGSYDTFDAVTGFQIYLSADNIIAGKFSIYEVVT